MKYIIPLLLIILFLGCGENGTNPQNLETKILFSPQDGSIAVGEEHHLSLELQNCSESIFALSLQIAYDDSLVSFSDSSGVSMGDFFGEDAILFVEEDASIIHLALTQIQGQGEVAGSGVLCVLTFTGKSSGESEVFVMQNEAHFFNASGNELTLTEIEFGNAAIVVN